MHDLVIRNGLLVDGSGAPPRPADIAVDGEHISLVAEPGGVADGGRREIEAGGRLVTPGWVDIHTHYDGQATWDPELSPSGWHGVTTVVMGNCGVGFAPSDPARRDWLINLMEGVEDIPGTALAEGMTWNWETFPEFLDELERMNRVMDVSALVPHGAVRAYVMGDRDANSEADADDLRRMADIVREAMRAGAVGFSTTRTLLHRSKTGELAAGTTSEPEELIAIGEAMGEAGSGVFEVADDMFVPEEEFAWMAEVSRASGGPVTFGLTQHDLDPVAWRRQIDLAKEISIDGVRVVPQVAGRPACMLLGWSTTVHPFGKHPAYREIAHLPDDERLARLRDPEVRARITGEPMTREGFNTVLGRWQKIFPLGDPPDYEPTPDQSVLAMAEREGRPAEEVAYDLMLADDGRGLLYLPLLGYSDNDFSALYEMLSDDTTVLGLGDGGAHCGMLCDASLPSYMLSHWTRDRDRGPRLSLEHAVHHQTQRTAQLYGFDDRGLVAPGYLADLNIIDLDELALEPPELVHDLPAGGKRLIQRARGYVATVKRGQLTYEDGEATGARPGRLLRGPQPAPA